MFFSTVISAGIFIHESVEDSIETSEISCFIDLKGKLSFEEILGVPFNDSLELAMDYLSRQNPTRHVWFRFTIESLDKVKRPLSISVPRYSRTKVYVIEEGKLTIEKSVGSEDIGQYYIQDIDQSSVPVLISKLTSEIYVQVINASSTVRRPEFYVFLATQENFDEYKIQNRPSKGGEGYVFLLFLGVMLFQALYVIIQWYLVRKGVYFFYVLYILTVFAYYYLRFSTFYSENPSWSLVDAVDLHNFNLILIIVPSIFYLLFASTFVDLKKRDPKLHKAIISFVIFLCFCVGIQVLLNSIPNDFDKQLPVTVSLFAQVPFNLIALVRIARQRRRTAWFLVAGSTVAFVAHFTANFLPSFIPIKYMVISPLEITMIGVILEVIIFNSGLLFKAKEAESDKVHAKNLYIQELKARQVIQTEYSQVRDKISSDLHDDVGSSLSSIGIYSYAARESLINGKTEQAVELLENIKRSAELTMNSMSDLVWATNPQNDSNNKLIERVQSFGFEILGAKDCVFRIDIDEKFIDLPFNQAQRKNLLLIMKEAINNTAKYAEATLFDLSIKVVGSSYTLNIQDNGKGFNLLSDQQGNGMNTMRKRCEELKGKFNISSSSKGTMISLQIPI